MRKYVRSCAPALAAAAALAVGVSILPASAAEMEQMTVVERASTDVVTDTGAEGDTVGDILTFANEIYDQANEKQIGSNNGWCVRTAVGKAWECFWTLTLKDGQITVAGPFYDAGDSVLAITGGTGTYAGVRGEMGLHARDAQGSAYDFSYKLIR